MPEKDIDAVSVSDAGVHVPDSYTSPLPPPPEPVPCVTTPFASIAVYGEIMLLAPAVALVASIHTTGVADALDLNCTLLIAICSPLYFCTIVSCGA